MGGAAMKQSTIRVCVCVYTLHSDGSTVDIDIILTPYTDSEAVKARALANVQSAFSNQETNQKTFTTNDLQETSESINIVYLWIDRQITCVLLQLINSTVWLIPVSQLMSSHSHPSSRDN